MTLPIAVLYGQGKTGLSMAQRRAISGSSRNASGYLGEYVIDQQRPLVPVDRPEVAPGATVRPTRLPRSSGPATAT